MQRVTISIDDALAESFDAMVAARRYASRSEAVRDLVRDSVERWREEDSVGSQCVGDFSYVYDRDVRQLAERLSGIEHDHHDLIVSTTALRLDHQHSLVSVLLRGATDKVHALIDQIAAQRGVRFATRNLIAVDRGDAHDHSHPHHHHHGHDHLSPVTG